MAHGDQGDQTCRGARKTKGTCRVMGTKETKETKQHLCSATMSTIRLTSSPQGRPPMCTSLAETRAPKLEETS